MPQALYKIRGLRLSLPDRSKKPLFGESPMIEILKGLDFDILRGEVLGIVGGSGSGKSTTGRALVRLLEPTGGSVMFDGIEISHLGEAALKPLRRRFQMIFQDPMSSLNPRQRVGRIIGSALEAAEFDNVPDRIAEAMEQVGLGQGFTMRFPHEMSGGQRQRVGIARAIATRPDFILADEIVSGLDVSSQAQILELLRKLVSELNLTLAFVSHDLSVIRMLCDRVIVMQHGEIIEMGSVDHVFSNPAHSYTQDLISSIPLADLKQSWDFDQPLPR